MQIFRGLKFRCFVNFNGLKVYFCMHSHSQNSAILENKITEFVLLTKYFPLKNLNKCAICILFSTIFHHAQEIRSGYLHKKGGRIPSWHKRWFILKGDLLFYYRNVNVSSCMHIHICICVNCMNCTNQNIDTPA